MSDRLFELKQEALEWSYKKYATDKSTGYDREHLCIQKLVELVLKETIDIMGVDSTLANGIMLHFGLE
jgi:hypothetical protein